MSEFKSIEDFVRSTRERHGCTLTCRRCGKSEFFEGGLLHSLAAAEASPNWAHDTGFVLCTACFNVEHSS